jgi:hypothetical protein
MCKVKLFVPNIFFKLVGIDQYWLKLTTNLLAKIGGYRFKPFLGFRSAVADHKAYPYGLFILDRYTTSIPLAAKKKG